MTSEDGDGMKDLPLGAQVLTAAFTGLSSLAGALTASVGPLEHPDVKEFAAGLSDQLNGMLAVAETAYARIYPEFAVAEADDSEVEAVAKHLGQSLATRRELAEVAFRLKRLSGLRKGMNSAERGMLKGATVRVERFLADARKFRAKVGDETEGVREAAGIPVDVTEALTSVTGVFKSVTNELWDVARRPARD